MDGSIPTPGKTARPGGLSRRRFVLTALTATGGLAIGFGSKHALAASVRNTPWTDHQTLPSDLDSWIAIEPDDTVLIRYARSEMGQGSMTALPMMINEELQADWAKVRVEYASANRSYREHNVYGDMSSVGSHSVRDSHAKMQQVGASARVRLVQAAATRWGVKPEECVADKSVVTHVPTKRSFRYGELAADAARIKLDKEPALKTQAQYTFIGSEVKRLDVPYKVDGSAQYAMDTKLPGMVFAAIAACPVRGGKLKAVDEAPLAGDPNIVKIVKLPNALAVVAKGTYWRAKQALAKLHPEWDTGAAGATDTALFNKEYRGELDKVGAIARNDGDIDKVIPAAARQMQAVYEVPYLAHATMEPMNATIWIQGDRLDAWVGSQAANRAHAMAAKVSGLKPENVYIHNTYVGGGFGRKSTSDEIAQAILIAKALGSTPIHSAPVKMIWTREEDMRQDHYRPQGACSFTAGLDASGMPQGWRIHTAIGSIMRSLGMSKVPNGIEPLAVEGLEDNPYQIPATRVECSLKNTHIEVGFWRSVGASQNAFFIESFMDEMAAAGGHDPYQFRRQLLKGNKEWLAVLDKAAEKGDWGKPLAPGKARGIAIHMCYNTIAAEVVEITMDTARGTFSVDRVTVAVDPGHVVNALGVKEQMEGGVIFALSAALYGKITVKNGVVEQGNFDSYRMVRYAQAPKIDVYMVPSNGKRWGGCGEPGAAPLTPALCNAIFSATGKRIRSLPIMDHDLSASA
ncbi:MAG TPA: molybdopterin cofactor-binding domain-containing protein [Stellaceae bacterium]|nr:molybdopterin cofactor-binding domain-containing protein [Stellaceae bacterium]